MNKRLILRDGWQGDTIRFRWSDGRSNAVEFTADNVHQFRRAAWDGLVTFWGSGKNTKRWHDGATRRYMRHYRDAQLHVQHDGQWLEFRVAVPEHDSASGRPVAVNLTHWRMPARDWTTRVHGPIVVEGEPPGRPVQMGDDELEALWYGAIGMITWSMELSAGIAGFVDDAMRQFGEGR